VSSKDFVFFLSLVLSLLSLVLSLLSLLSLETK
jgi:hypothetical protein